jgi:rubrerythrin
VREVRKQENKHLTWAEKMLTRAANEGAHHQPERDDREKSDGEVKEAGTEQDY